MADSAQSPDTSRVSSAELARNIAYWQEQALERPITITYHGRDRLVLAPVAMHNASSAGAAKAPLTAGYELLKDNMLEGFLSWDSGMRCLELNSVAELYFGVSRAMFIGKTYKECLGQDIPPELQDALARTLEFGEATDIEFDSTLFPGRRLHVRVFAAGNGGAACVFSNVTERVALERRIAKKESIIAAIEANGGIGIAHLDGFGRMTWSCAALAAWGGFEPREFEGRLFSDLLARQHKRPFQECFIEVLQGRVPATIDVDCISKGVANVPIHIALAPRLEGYAVVGAAMIATLRGVQAS